MMLKFLPLLLSLVSLQASAAVGGPKKVDAGIIRNGSATLTLPTTSTTIVGRTTTDALTNKDIDGGTASNSSRITLPKSDTTTLNGLTRKQGTVAYDTTRNKAVIDNGTSLLPVGSGSGGGVNFIGQTTTWSPDNTDDRDLETSVGNWVSFADAAAATPVDLTGGAPTVTCTRGTTNPLDGAGSLLITKDAANRQGEGCSVVFNVQPAYQGSNATITFPLNVVSGSIVSGDAKVFIYNVTKSTLITPFNNDVLQGPSITATFPTTAKDASPVNHQYRLGIYFASTSTTAVTLKADNFSVSPVVASYGAAGSDWLSFPGLTFSGYGTVTTTVAQYRRDKDSLHARGYFIGGTPSGTLSINLPAPFLIDLTKVPVSGSSGGDVGRIEILSGTTPSGAAGPYVLFSDGTTNNQIFVNATAASSAFVKAAGATAATASMANYFDFTVPIAGWDANVSMAQSSTFRISSFLANGTRVTGAAPANLGEYRTYLRNAGARTYTETGAAPTPSPTASDGMKLWGGNGSANADTANSPSRYDIFVGKNKQVKLETYSAAGRTGVYNPQSFTNYGNTTDVGTLWSYDPTAGVVTVMAIGTVNGGNTGGAVGLDSTTTALNSGYFDITVSENALAVGVQAPRSSVEVNTGNGHGSTNTKIRRFSNVLKNKGTAITYADSPTLGGSFTINEDGVYSVSYNDVAAAGYNIGISRNSTQLTTNVTSINDADLIIPAEGGANVKTLVTATVLLSAGDVIRAHTDGQANGTTAPNTRFIITKVSN